MRKSHKMERREIANRIAQANVQALKVRMVVFTRQLKEKNMVGKFHQS
tara:strand:- start:49 stop:192 length:144 start_codon:yes stop_codon:yes gene_type:complete